jgi:serine-type D-Ala-D-Ala carboxypeptidase/endopeptidase
MLRATIGVMMAGLMIATTVQARQDAGTPSDAAIRQVLAERIDTMHQGVGLVVGVIDASGRRVVAYGKLDQDNTRALDGDTIFEIGSVTKIFTALLLADMVERHEVALDDPIAKYLPAGVNAPERDGHAITLVDLATHTSGLPRLPTNLRPANPQDPYVDYTEPDLEAFLRSYQLPRNPGAEFEYSNLGDGLLGWLLARRAGMDYGALVRARITGPLGMTSTDVMVPTDNEARLAPGHNDSLRRVPAWHFAVLAGCGALRSTANDLLKLLAAFLGEAQTPLAPAMALMPTVRRPTGSAMGDISLGWLISKPAVEEILWHNGGTYGYRSFAGLDMRTHTGVLVLSNAFTTAGVDDIGRHVLDPKAPLLAPTTARKEVTLDAKTLENYVGEYQLAPSFVLTITHEGDGLFAQATGQGKLPIFAEGPREFFYKAVDAQITFETDATGRAVSLTLRQNGATIPGKRIKAPLRW